MASLPPTTLQGVMVTPAEPTDSPLGVSDVAPTTSDSRTVLPVLRDDDTETIPHRSIPRSVSPFRASMHIAGKLFVNVPKARLGTFCRYMCVRSISRTVLASVLMLVGLALVGTGLAIGIQGKGQRTPWVIGIPFIAVGGFCFVPSLFEFCRLCVGYTREIPTL